MSQEFMTQINHQLAQRQKELKEELRQVEAAMSALAASDGTPKKARKRPYKKRRQQVLDIVAGAPGLTASEVADKASSSASNIYGVLKRLEDSGDVVKSGKQYFPAPSPPSELLL